MTQRFSLKVFCAALMVSTVCLAAPVAEAQAQAKPAKGAQSQSQSTLTAAQAAKKAQARHGGKVLKVTPQGPGYRVKLLTDSGRVLSVTIGD